MPSGILQVKYAMSVKTLKSPGATSFIFEEKKSMKKCMNKVIVINNSKHANKLFTLSYSMSECLYLSSGGNGPP